MITKFLLKPEPNNFSNSCLFVSKYHIQRVYCPFKVLCTQNIRGIRKGEELQVDRILSWDNGTILYSIQSKLYPHHHFKYIPPYYYIITGLE